MDRNNIIIGDNSDLFRRIPGTNSLYLNLVTFVIVDKDGYLVKLKRTKTHIVINMYGFIKSVEKEWLKWITYYNIEVPEEVSHLIFDIKFYKYKHVNARYYEPVIAIAKKPIYVDSDKRFRLIPMYPDYAIDKDGIVLKLKTNTTLNPPALNIDSYPEKNLYSRVVKDIITLKIHRLVAMVWVSNDNYVEKGYINHKDGNKHNSNYKNLEWLSSSDNNKHAQETGLKTDYIATELRNVDTNEIVVAKNTAELLSITDKKGLYAKIVGENPGRIWTNKKGERYEGRILGSGKPWVYEGISNPVDKTRVDMLITVHFKDGHTEEFYNGGQLSNRFYGKKIATNIKDLIRYIKNKFTEVLDIQYDVKKINNKSMQALNVETGEVTTADSKAALARKLGIAHSTITRAFKADDNCRFFLKWIFRHTPENPDEKWCDEKDRYTIQKIVICKVINDNTGESNIVSGIDNLTRKYGLSKWFLSDLTKNNNNNKINFKHYTIELLNRYE